MAVVPCSVRACCSPGILTRRRIRPILNYLITTRDLSSAVSRSMSTQGSSIFDREDLRKLYPDIDNIDPADRVMGATVTPPEELPIIHVKCSFNNTMFTITNSAGRVLAWTSAGAEGFKNARRGTTIAAQAAGTSAAHKAIKLGLKQVKLRIKGLGPGRQSSMKGLVSGGITVHSVQDVTPVPHNGCRPRKVARK